MKTNRKTAKKPAGKGRKSTRREEVRIMVSPATLKKARRLARERGRRLPDFLSEVVVAFIDDTEGYRDSLRRLEQRLDTGLDLGTGGSAGWNREELHAR